MRKTVFFGAMCLLATVVMAGSKITPMNVRLGMWENHSTIAVTGGIGIPPEMLAQMTPEQRARVEAAMKNHPGASGVPREHVSKGCLTQKDLNSDPFGKMSQEKDMKCEETVLNSTGTDLNVKTTCTEGTTKGDMHLHFHALSSEHVIGTGEGTVTMGGRTMHSNMKMDMKWIGATCTKDSE